MIKSLYTRIVLTFVLVVLVSIFIAFGVFAQTFKSQDLNQLEANMFDAGREVVSLYTTVPEKAEELLAQSTLLKQYQVEVFSETGQVKSFASSANGQKKDKERDYSIATELVELVIAGEKYNSFSEKVRFGHKSPLIGLPFQVEGQSYAVFIKPDFEGMFKSIIRSIITILLMVLLIGSLFILIATRYLIKPLEAMTRATKQLAKGNFDIELKVKQKDELGKLAESFNDMARELKQLEQMRQDFVSNVSHEIQSPLTSIKGFSTALKEWDLTEEERLRYLDIIETETGRLSRLSENLLNLASLESEQHPFEPKTFGLDEQIRRVVVAMEPQWVAKNIEIDLKLIPARLTADEDQLNQVWLNLLNNSIRYTPEGGTVTIKLEQRANQVIVSISDTGIGISDEDQKHIFQRFYKADKARTRNKSGSGLGLAIVRKIVTIHQGEIAVQSKPGEGATFIVTLPIQP